MVDSTDTIVDGEAAGAQTAVPAAHDETRAMLEVDAMGVVVPPAELLNALSQAFAYPVKGLAETQRALRAYSATRGLGDSWSERIGEVLSAGSQFADLTSQQLAYTRLFIGSLKMEAPPYASFYLEEEHTLNGQAAVEVAEVYRQFGLVLDASEIAPADHLRYLLAFLALLAARWEETGEEAFAQAYVDFRDDYLLTWIDECADLVERNAEEPYYPALVKLIVDVLKLR